MNILIAGATGFIGQALTHALQKKKNTITVISRKQKTARKIFTDKNIRIETWDSLRTAVPALIPKQDVIINLCGANIAEKRWSKQRKQVLLDSRLIPTRTLLQLCKDTQSRPTFINASGIGIYGLSETRDNRVVTEITPLPNPPVDFLAELSAQWEDCAYSNALNNQRVITLRFAPVLDPSGGMMKKLATLFKLGLAGPIGNGQQPFPWVSLNDAIAAIQFVIHHTSVSGPVNIVYPKVKTQKDLFTIIANSINRPAIVPMPGFAVKMLYGEMGKVLLLHGIDAHPQKLLDAGFIFSDTSPGLKKAN